MNQSIADRPATSHQVLPPIFIGLLPSSPIGPIWVAVSELGLVAVNWNISQVDFSHRMERRLHTNVVYDEFQTGEALRQISEYLAGIRCKFDLQLDLSDRSNFQLQVLHLTLNIPYSQTSTYKEIAIHLGKEHAARAVGRVEATNPIPLVIPCHRVLGSDGSLHGYGGPGGIKLKAWLLKLEQNSV
jgi:methylated-DNA-[protein]-cysteine S-methyltransferase